MTLYPIIGDWLGTYEYAEIFPAQEWDGRFRALFTATYHNSSGENFTGAIFDVGHLGVANISQGFQDGRNIQFFKTYVVETFETRPVFYWGELSEDGQSLHGFWQIQNFGPVESAHGSWSARRYPSAIAEQQFEQQKAEYRARLIE